MPYDTTTNQWILTDLMLKLQQEKKAGFELQKRKHDDWTDNYELYRNKVKTNRLTQRQAVNIPLMKETIKTLISRVDDAPNIDWQETSGDESKEIIYQEMWNQSSKDNNLELIDILDKKNVLLYGLSTKKLNITDKGIGISVLDPYDILIDPLTNSWDLESARYIIHQNIFRPVRDILSDDKYNQEGKEQLKMFADSPQGILMGSKNKEEWERKMERLRSMGVNHSDFALYPGGDFIVNLTEHFTKVWDSKKAEFVKKVIVYANDTIELYNETLQDCLGVDFYPFVIWSEDPENIDIYPDSVADLVRTPNKVLNVWFSQLIENRTLKNFQMHWVSASGSYTPQTFTPGPGMQLPAPPLSNTGKIDDVIKPVEISGLDDTLEAISVLTNIVERGTGATAIEKGQAEEGQQTLGEIQILVGKAGERTTAMAKFYRIAWYELAVKWDKLMNANPPKIMKLYKTGRSGKLYEKKVSPTDWKGYYKPLVRSSSEQESEQTKGIQKFMFVMSQFPNNSALRKIAQKRELEILDLTPEELKQVEEAEDQAMQMAQQATQQPQQSAENPELSQLNERMQQVQQLMVA